MLAKCYSGAVNGVDARMVEIEVYSTVGISETLVPLCDRGEDALCG